MRYLLFILVLILICLPLFADHPSEEPNPKYSQWKICNVDTDCGVVEIGCYKWEPVNKQYAKEMMDDFFQNNACMRSTQAGTIPKVACIDKTCVKQKGEGAPETAFHAHTSGGIFDVQ